MRDYNNPKTLLLKTEDTVLSAIEKLDECTAQIVLVTDKAGALQGVITDGDVRRGLIKGLSLESSVVDIMKTDFVSADEAASDEEIEMLARARLVRQIPVLSSGGLLQRLVMTISADMPVKRPNKIIIMAGGLGIRMRPLTENIPKPMLRIGDQPILEIILRNLVQEGFFDIMISVNYKKQVIMDYFGDGSKFGCSITYLEEDKRLGTAGALGLLHQQPSHPFLVMNGDLITSLSFDKLLDHHEENASEATICVRKHTVEVPFGVVEEADGRLVSIEEKPQHKFLINAGVYAISPETLASLPEGESIDMPDFIEGIVKSGGHVGVFLVHESWKDIGRPEDLVSVNKGLGPVS
ncbi:nucleotidyltransferase family protein [Alphaproteobacteria bacterium]|nr:nucleotidyltransferase family protein [Alphaproteobacteria bacterium]